MLEGINTRLGDTKELISNLKYRIIKIILDSKNENKKWEQFRRQQ